MSVKSVLDHKAYLLKLPTFQTSDYILWSLCNQRPVWCDAAVAHKDEGDSKRSEGV